MFPTGDKSNTPRDTWANLIPNPYQPDRKWRALHAARGKQNLQTVLGAFNDYVETILPLFDHVRGHF